MSTPRQEEQRAEPELLRRIERRRESYGERSAAFRIVWVVAALIVLAAGLAMTVLPGPAVIVIPLGLAMLSLEFAWAQRLVEKAIRSGAEAQDKVADASPEAKALGGLAVALAIAAATALAVLLLF